VFREDKRCISLANISFPVPFSPVIRILASVLATLVTTLISFGHDRGAFTDAYESRPGKFEAANGGSLFMDEIGNLPLALQAKLLTVLQNRNITRIGSNKVIPVDIRLISATNKDIPEMIKEGLFREDLFYRINTIHLEIPPLRERGDDLLLFIDAFFIASLPNINDRKCECMSKRLKSYAPIIGRAISGNCNTPSKRRLFYAKAT